MHEIMSEFDDCDAYASNRSMADRFLERIDAKLVPVAKYAVLLSALEDEGQLKVKWIAPRNNHGDGQVGDLLTATNPLARGSNVPSAHGAGRFDLLHQPDLIPLHVNKHSLGHNTVYTLGLSEDGSRLNAFASDGNGINSSEEIQELLSDRPEMARLREGVYREYHEALEGDITARLGMVASQMAAITEMARRIGIEVPPRDTNLA